MKALVREGMGLTELIEDHDGDLPFRRGSAAYFISTRLDGQKLKVWSCAVSDVKATVAVLREINDANLELESARVIARGDNVYVEGTLPVESTTAADLVALCHEVATTADDLGSMLAAVHGGTTWFSEDDKECQCGSGE